MPRFHLRRVALGIALLALVALWLMALPTLLVRDGLARHNGACPIWRDPVTGRTLPLPARGRDIACDADTSVARR